MLPVDLRCAIMRLSSVLLGNWCQMKLNVPGSNAQGAETPVSERSARKEEKMTKPRVYVETSIISYLVSRPSKILIIAANQQLTREWWDARRRFFDLVISDVVVQECERGDRIAAKARLQISEELPLLEVTREAVELAATFLKKGAIPSGSERDALHVSVAAVHGVEFLLTWNCTHIANAEMQRGMARVATSKGYALPVLCTPLELMGGR